MLCCEGLRIIWSSQPSASPECILSGSHFECGRNEGLIRRACWCSSRSWQAMRIPTGLLAAVVACKNGVKRAHLVDTRIDGGLILELYSRDGVGTMISTDFYEARRRAYFGSPLASTVACTGHCERVLASCKAEVETHECLKGSKGICVCSGHHRPRCMCMRAACQCHAPLCTGRVMLQV
jgi:hypothetical protein